MNFVACTSPRHSVVQDFVKQLMSVWIELLKLYTFEPKHPNLLSGSFFSLFCLLEEVDCSDLKLFGSVSF